MSWCFQGDCLNSKFNDILSAVLICFARPCFLREHVCVIGIWEYEPLFVISWYWDDITFEAISNKGSIWFYRITCDMNQQIFNNSTSSDKIDEIL